MDCPFCDSPKSHKHRKTSKGSQRYRCADRHRAFTDTFDTLYYRRQVTPEQVETILQAHAEGSSLRGISRIGKQNMQRLERTNGTIRQQTGRWHRRQNKFSKLWEQTEVTARLVVGYFNWIWRHSRTKLP